MKNGNEYFVTGMKKGATIVTLAIGIGSSGMTGLAAQGLAILVQPEKQVTTVQSKFYCNTKALTVEERARHKSLTEKLMAVRKEIVETEKGYEFQYRPRRKTGVSAVDGRRRDQGVYPCGVQNGEMR